ncbi:DNA polymerase III subunit chi [Pseudacidovorax intermedius]|uniref:DNA polymerase III subunit chi n=1 Tax=Pseudacidovorax intermedius TaxID=433924 RepID=A0A147GNY9_9BURK|nr:DNA polymerase III subunit chi [Pseudacidovorax intermedius]KTT15789.1 DNA polymerase III subunit chi [Pseudacidovorax intermedius]
MTEIDVHYNTSDKLRHACRLLRKAVLGAGAQVVVQGPAPLLDALDEALWLFSPADFIAHCKADAPVHVRGRSPVVLGLAEGDAPSHRQVMLNLGVDLPAGFERFERLIDIVGLDDAERLAGRNRWRHYADRGYAITRHDVGARTAQAADAA